MQQIQIGQTILAVGIGFIHKVKVVEICPYRDSVLIKDEIGDGFYCDGIHGYTIFPEDQLEEATLAAKIKLGAWNNAEIQSLQRKIDKLKLDIENLEVVKHGF